MRDTSIKLCFATSSLGKGGAEKQLYLLLKNLDRSLYSPVVITFSDGPWKSDIEALHIPVVTLRARTRIGRFFCSFAYLVRYRPHVLHCFGASAGFIVRPAAIFARIPTIIASERYVVQTKNNIKLIFEKLLGLGSDFVICNARHSATFYEEQGILPPKKIRVIRNGIESQETGEWSPPAEPCIGYLANLREGKNHEFLIHAFDAMRRRYPRLKLLLAGEGPRRKYIEKLVESLGISESVEILGTISDQSSFFKRLSVYCHVSLYEGIPNSIMEAMARGVPCVASDIPGNRELITHEISGLLVSPTSVGELSDGVLRLLSNPVLSKHFGETARQFLMDNFSIEQMVKATTNLYPKFTGAPSIMRKLKDEATPESDLASSLLP